MATVQIKVASTDRTDAVIFGTAYFSSAVNGVGGEAKLRFRDPTRTLSIVVGSTLELLIDGDPVWTGFVSTANRVYAFPAIKVTESSSETRFIDVVGIDINILFAKRIVFDQTTPENVLAPLYGPNTPDTTALTALFSGWLDLTGDGIDTSSGVVGVGNINVDQDARAWEGTDTWGQAVASIALLPAAIYYIRPDKVFAYVDTDTPDAPFGLSDVPNGTTKRGYREMEILLDGSNLGNDVLCWGLGYGSSVPVFKRDIDATSVTDHGLWQIGLVTYGIYKQATIDRVADSILNGSPDHHRGAKDDRPAVTLTTYEAGLLPAQKVAFESQVFGWSDVIPIRKMEVTFESPDNPKYVLTLSHEIDTPWSFFDPWRLGGFQPHIPHLREWPPGQTGDPTPQLPGPTACYRIVAYDDFQRTVAPNGWGSTSRDSLPWTVIVTDPGQSAYVDGDDGVLVSNYHTATSTSSRARLSGGFLSTSAFSLRAEFSFETDPPMGTNPGRSGEEGILIHQLDSGTERNFVTLAGFNAGAYNDPFLTRLEISSDLPPLSTDPPSHIDLPWQVTGGVQYFLEWEYNLGTGLHHARVWRPQVEARPDWQVSGQPRTGAVTTFEVFEVSRAEGIAGTVSGAATMHVQSLDVYDCPDGPIQGVILNAYVCEEIPSVGSPTIVLQRDFLPGSLTVWVAGLLQLPADYVEHPEFGSLVLSFSPPTGAIVRVCYWSLP